MNRKTSALIAIILFTLITTLAKPFSTSRAVNTSIQDDQEKLKEEPQCPMGPRNPLEVQKIQKELDDFISERKSSAERGETSPTAVSTITISVHVHVINKGVGEDNGDVSDSKIEEQINVLNRAFGGEPGGANTNFRFTHIGTTRTTNATWFAAGYSLAEGRPSAEARKMQEALHVSGANVLNLYIKDIPDPVTGWSSFPREYTSAPKLDGVVIRYSRLPGETIFYDDGDTATHEVGHWLGLFHTFQGGCSSPNDGIADTPAELQPKSDEMFCVLPHDSCPNLAGNDPHHNYMTYKMDSCLTEFTAGQSARMDALYAQHRKDRIIDSVTHNIDRVVGVTGGKAVTATLRLTSPAPAAGRWIDLASGSSSVATVPSKIFVPGGSKTKSFTISTKPVSNMSVVEIYASIIGVEPARTVPLTVQPPRLTGLILNPTSAVGACQTSVGKVALDGQAPAGGVLIKLTSSDPAVAQVGSGITVPAGLTSATFLITTSQVASKKLVTIDAKPSSLNFGPNSAKVLTVTSIGVNTLSLQPNPALAQERVVGTVAVSCKVPAGSGGIPVTLTSSALGVAQPDLLSINIPEGASTGKFNITTKAVLAISYTTITARANGVAKAVNLAVYPSSCPNPPSGIVSWWPGEGNAVDVGGSGGNGVALGGLTFAPGKVGQAFKFDGIDDYISAGNPAALKLSKAITLEAWVNPADMPEGGQAAVVSKWGQSTSRDSYLLFLSRQGGVVRLAGAIGVAGVSDQGFSGGSITPNTWNHVVMTYNAITGQNILYLNGRLVASRTWAGGIFVSDTKVMIGGEDSSLQRRFKGMLDEVGIYNRAISASEAQAIYQAGSRGRCGAVSGVWPMSGHDSQRRGLSPFVGPGLITRGPSWVVQTGGPVQGDIVASKEGILYFVSDKLYALNPNGTNYVPPVPLPGIPSGTPAVDDLNGYVYFAFMVTNSNFNNDFMIIRYDKQLQNQVTVYQGVAATYGGISPLIVGPDGSVYFISGRFPGTVRVLGPTPWSRAVCPQEASGAPALGTDGSVYVGCPGNAIYKLNGKTGAELKKYPYGGNTTEPMIDYQGNIIAGFQAFNGIVYYGAYSKWGPDLNLLIEGHDTLDFTNSRASLMPDGASTIRISYADAYSTVLSHRGAVTWDVDFRRPEFLSSRPTVDASGKIFVGKGTALTCLNPTNGTPFWSQTTVGAVTTQPVIGKTGAVYVGTDSGKIYAY